MKLLFTKNTGKPHIIKYFRSNGTNTWMKADHYFIYHDLSHYAIEKTLGFTTAFYGLINNGVELSDFADREKRISMSLTKEDLYAESMANLFLMEITPGKIDNFNAMQQQAFAAVTDQHLPLKLSDEEIETIRDYLKNLLSQWKALPDSGNLELQIDV